jgi:WXG100 family type VII secretion target
MWTDELTDVNPQSVRNAADRIDVANQAITLLRQRVQTHRAELASGWRDAAATQFGLILDRWDGDFQGIQDQLQTLHDGLSDAKSTYEQTVHDRVEAASQLRGLLNYS